MSERHKVVVIYENGLKKTFTRTNLTDAAKLRTKMGARADVKDATLISPAPKLPKRKDMK